MQFYWSYALVLNMCISYDFQCRFDDEKVREAVKGGDFFFPMHLHHTALIGEKLTSVIGQKTVVFSPFFPSCEAKNRSNSQI